MPHQPRLFDLSQIGPQRRGWPGHLRERARKTRFALLPGHDDAETSAPTSGIVKCEALPPDPKLTELPGGLLGGAKVSITTTAPLMWRKPAHPFRY
jgi:hypothetical protein